VKPSHVAFYDESDDLITHWLDNNGVFERYIFTEVAGVTFHNRDGSSRQEALRICKPLDRIVLSWEIENPVSRTAIAVSLETGQQLGYLNSRLGDDTYKRVQKGEYWIGFLVRVVGHERLGATIVIVKLKKEKPAPKPIPLSL
jgi:hypothetical protein